MSQSANDWASPDPTMNMTLADADQLRYALAGALTIQFGSVYVRTQYNEIISEAELRANNYMSPLPVNLCGHLAMPGCIEFNIAQFRTQIRAIAQSSDPTGGLVMYLQQLCPQDTAIPSIFTRVPAVQAVITAAMKTI